MKNRLILSTIVIFSLLHARADAAAPLTCTPDLFKDYSKGGYSDAATLQTLDIVDRTNWDTFKQNFSGNVTVPIDGVPVDFGASYESFNETRTRVYTEHRFSSSKNTSLQWLNITYGTVGGTAYAKCLEAYIKVTSGIHIWASNVSAGGATVNVQWVAPAGMGKVMAKIKGTGAADGKTDVSVDLVPSGASNFAIKRQADEEVRLYVNVPGYADDLVIPPDPKIAVAPVAPTSSPTIVAVITASPSSDNTSAPLNENTWGVDFPIRDRSHIGIGFTVEPEPFRRDWTPNDFTMHDHHGKAGEPDQTRSFITYEFDKPARVADVLIIQHVDGITEIEGFVGDDVNTLQSIGKSTSLIVSPLPLRQNAFVPGARDVFSFPQARQGKLFRIVITKTSSPAPAYAMYRAYPRDSNHSVFRVRDF